MARTSRGSPTARPYASAIPWCWRGRAPGEMTRLITGGLTRARPDIGIAAAGDLKDAVGIALAAAAPGEPVLLLYEKLQPVTDLPRTLGASPAS
jgi:cyanophycin synthetase